MTLSLFEDPDGAFPVEKEALCPGAWVLRRFALAESHELLAALAGVEAVAPLRHMTTPGGFTMSVAMTNCGVRGWCTDASGYRYRTQDPCTGQAWPDMPDAFRSLAIRAATEAGFTNFQPDACLINQYRPGARLALHQDKDERDLSQPIVSVSLGIPAIFLFGGMRRQERSARIPLLHGDVVVWGGPARLRYHGIAPVKEAVHPLTGPVRLNLTFRKAA